MFNRKDAVFVAVAGLLMSSGYAMADGTSSAAPKLSLSPSVMTADDAATAAPLMGLFDKAGVGKTLEDAKLNVYGWVEAGYTYDHRHGSGSAAHGIVPGPFNHEVGNHFMLNQVDLRFERQIDATKFDVGGMIEVQYGTDAKLIHSSGLNFGGSDPSTDNVPADAVNDRFQANYEFDLTQAYIDVGVPVGNGLKLRIGKFVTLLGYETIDPRGNPFYSHSYAFGALPFTQTGVLGMYTINDQWAVTAGLTRGWDQTLEDSGPNGGTCYPDFLGQVAWTPNKQLSAYLNLNSGPQSFGDRSHYRTVINPIVTYQVTDALKLGFEALYIYDGSLNSDLIGTGVSHAYGDVWSGDLYVGYTLNDYVTVNGRFEKYHTSAEGTLGAVAAPSGGSLNIYSATLGVTVTPLPKDPIGKNLSFRPEVRYDWSDSAANPPFVAGTGRDFRDQLTFAADVIFKF